jgi:hypothetical protein
MPRLSRAQRASRQQIAALGAGGLLPESFGRRLLIALQEAIPADGMRLFCVDSSTLLYNRLVAATEGDGAFRARWLREIYLSHGPAAYMSPPLVMRANLPVTLIKDRQDS